MHALPFWRIVSRRTHESPAMADEDRRGTVPRAGRGAPEEPTRTSGAEVSPGRATSPGELWGDLQILAELGRGSFGRVYRAWDSNLDREVALKISPTMSIPRGASLLREGQLLARVRHRNIVTVHGAQKIGDEIGVWMELIQGRTLGQILKESGPMGPEEATVIGVSLCHALAAVHAAGLIHRDVKAQNVMRESGGRIVLMDFGAGRDLADLVDLRDYTGTPLYMAPELFRGGVATPASDIYSLGVILFHLVTGEYPVEGRSFTDLLVAHREGRHRLLADRRPDLPGGFIRAVEHALAPQARDRPQSAGAFLQELAEILPRARAEALDAANAAAGPQRGPRPAAGVQRAPRPFPIVARWLIGLAAAVAAVGVLGFLMSAAFDLALGREAGFSDDSPADWWLYGARSLVAPAVYTALAVIAVRVVAAGWDLALQVVPPLRRWDERGRAGLARTLERSGGPGGASAAQRLLLVQVVLLAGVLIWFRDIVNAFPIWVDTADAATLAILRPDNARLELYRGMLTLLLLAMALSWRAMLRRSPARAMDRGTIVGGVAVMALVLLMLEVPWRLIYKSDFPRVTFAGARCYQTGRNGEDLLLFCPENPRPRNTSVKASDPRLTPTGVRESIFEAPK
jgi:hypothetical protein